MLLRGPLDPVLDDLDLVPVVLGGVAPVVDVAPRRADMLGIVDRVPLVGRVGELDVAVLVLAPLGVHVHPPLDPFDHLKLLSLTLATPVDSTDARESRSRTSASVVWEKSSYQAPTA